MKKPRKLLLGMGIALLSATVLFTGGVVSKYVNERESEGSVQAAEFYFESNYLTEDHHQYKLNAATESVVIELYNFENELRVSNVKTAYTIKVNGHETVLEAPAGTATTKKYTLTVQPGKTYTVTAEANGGYKKTLSATFVVANQAEGIYKNVADKGEYVLLTVWTENVNGTVQINFPAGLIPDATDPRLSGVYNYSNKKYVAGSFEDDVSFAAPFASHAYRFFKTADFDSAAFTVTITADGNTIEALNSNIP
ncbi:MAG: hypothetical protein IKU55_05100 [Clostridia bacterium]|nr:hypothetical protein [Clostridia bacterium]